MYRLVIMGGLLLLIDLFDFCWFCFYLDENDLILGIVIREFDRREVVLGF